MRSVLLCQAAFLEDVNNPTFLILGDDLTAVLRLTLRRGFPKQTLTTRGLLLY